MKKVSKLLGILLVSLLVILPLKAVAESSNEKVNIYFFRGEGCPHCQEAETWFDGLSDDIKAKYNLVDYETWYNQDNSSLMKNVASTLGDDASGVPYIVIGDKSFIGFQDSTKDAILAQIDKLYNTTDRYDVMDHLGETNSNTKKNNNTAVTIILISIIVIGGGALIYYVSKSN